MHVKPRETNRQPVHHIGRGSTAASACNVWSTRGQDRPPAGVKTTREWGNRPPHLHRGKLPRTEGKVPATVAESSFAEGMTEREPPAGRTNLARLAQTASTNFLGPGRKVPATVAESSFAEGMTEREPPAGRSTRRRSTNRPTRGTPKGMEKVAAETSGHNGGGRLSRLDSGGRGPQISTPPSCTGQDLILPRGTQKVATATFSIQYLG